MPDTRGHGGHGAGSVGSRWTPRDHLLRVWATHERLVAVDAPGTAAAQEVQVPKSQRHMVVWFSAHSMGVKAAGRRFSLGMKYCGLLCWIELAPSDKKAEVLSIVKFGSFGF